MRVTACGTGTPSARPKQVAACFLVELGNGDKLILNIWSGSFERLSALSIPFDREIASLYSSGTILVDARPEWKPRFVGLASQLKEMAK